MQSFEPAGRKWQHDFEADRCTKCSVSFGMTVWRHHCRICGRVFCAECSDNFAYLPESTLCPDIPIGMKSRGPHRTCMGCIHSLAMLDSLEYISPLNYIPTVDTLEYDQSLPSSLYQITVPHGCLPQQLLQVCLTGGTRESIIIPNGIRGGHSLYVRSNRLSGTSSNGNHGNNNRSHSTVLEERTYLVTVLVAHEDPSQDLESSHPRNRSQEYDGTICQEKVPDDAFLECSSCTYHNLLTAGVCTMCGAALLS
jgi:hypothetical protein